MITPQPGYIVDPNNSNAVIRDPNIATAPGGFPDVAPLPPGTSHPPITSLSGASSAPAAVSSTTIAPAPASNITPPGPGLGGAGFVDAMNGIQKSFDATNPLLQQRQSLLQHLYLGTPLTPDQLSKLPPDMQKLIQSGNTPLLQVQLAAINDQISGRSNSLANSISFLTTGYQKAQSDYNTALNTITSISQQTGQSPVDILKALHPEIWANMSPDQQKLWQSIPAPYRKSTQVIGSTGGFPSGAKIPGSAAAVNNATGIKDPTTGAFKVFSTPEASIAATVNQLQMYQNGTSTSGINGDSTLEQATNMYTTGNPSVAGGYTAKDIASALGVSPTAPISQLDPEAWAHQIAKLETGWSPANAVTPTVQAYVDGIASGTITSIAQVPAAYKDSVALAMKSQGVQSPLGDRRYTLAASAIAANYIDLPGYQLTANGLPYLQRIAAAQATPGSISDQDLLDSLTKLNTSGNAITDAQVSIITGGKSFADMVSVFQNKFDTGGVLSDEQRKQIQTIANAIYANYAKGYQPIYDQVTKQFTAAGIPKQFWTIPDLNALAKESGLSIPGVTDTGGAIAPSDIPTGYYQASDGLLYKK